MTKQEIRQEFEDIKRQFRKGLITPKEKDNALVQLLCEMLYLGLRGY